jgi:yecA family protein
MTRYEAFLEKSWRETGITQLLVARIRADGHADLGFFLVDFWCLGVKDAFLHEDMPESEFRELIREQLPEEFRERLHPACAKKMVDGAIAYAERLGFAPHRDYRKARRALGGIDAAACPEPIAFGRNGRPCFAAGPNDDDDRIERVLAILEARLGPDGFDYILPEEEDEEEGPRAELQQFFAGRDEEGVDFYQFAGMVAALHVCPRPVMPTALLERLWGKEGRTWADAEELAEFTAALHGYWNEIAELAATCAAASRESTEPSLIDIFADDLDAPDDEATGKLYAATVVLWCRGFLRATREWPEAWGDALTRTDLAPHWATVRAWADPGAPEHRSYFEQEDAGSGFNPPGAVQALLCALRPAGPGAR